MRSRTSTLFCILALSLAALTPSAFGATYYVATTGLDSNPGSSAQPWATVQKAVDTIANGDTIIVRNGTYAGARITKAGVAGQPKTLQAETRWGVKLNTPPAGNRAKHGGVLELENFPGEGAPIAYWVIDGFEVDGQSLYRAIDIRGQGWGTSGELQADHITIRNCNAHHAKAGAAISTGIFDAYSGYCLYENNVTHHNTEHGMYHSNNSAYGTIRGNTSYSNSGAGYHNNGDESLAEGGPGVIRYVLYDRNIAYGNGGGGGINCDGESESVYRNNLIFANNNTNGMTFYDGNAAQGSRNNKIYNNTVINPAGGRYAILVGAGAINNEFYNNILFSQHGSKGSYTIAAGSVGTFQSDYNVVMNYGFNTDGDNTIGGTTLAQWQGLGYDTHSVTGVALADLFTDPAGGDYHLKAGSPAIDAGTTTLIPVDPTFTTDMDSRARVVNGLIDIGCYEYSGQPMVAKPSFAPSAGTYIDYVDVTITCATGGAVIRYTLDGNAPTGASPQYTTPLHITSTTTVSAKAFNAGMDDSLVESGLYTIGQIVPQTTVTFQEGTDGYTAWEDTWINGDTDAPGTQPNTNYSADEVYHLQYFTPDAQLHRFSIAAIPAGKRIASAKIYIYAFGTVQGTPTVSGYRVIRHWVEAQATFNKASTSPNVPWAAPGASGAGDIDTVALGTSAAATAAGWVEVDITAAVDGWYKSTFPNEGVVLKLSAARKLDTYSSKSGMTQYRPKVTIVFEEQIQNVATPTFDPAPASYLGAVDVTINCSTAGAEIRYTIDGSDPDATSNLYSSPVHITVTTPLKARAMKSGMNNSNIASGVYDISGTIATPTFAPPAGTYGSAIDVVISCASIGATIHFTTNGDTPTSGSPTYATPIHLTTTTTIKAIATKGGIPDSTIATGVFRVDTQNPSVSPPATVPTYVRAAVDTSIVLTATATDASTGNSNITAAECFEGSDPGVGGGTAMSAADGAFNSATEALTVALNCSAWAAPTPRRLYVRAKDAANHWSSAQSILVSVVSAVPPGAVADLTVASDVSYVKAPLSIVSVSSQDAAQPATNLTDGDLLTFWSTLGAVAPETETIVADLGQETDFAAVAICTPKPALLFPPEMTIAVSSNQVDWTTVARGAGFKVTPASRFIWLFEKVTARYIKISGPAVFDKDSGEYLWQIAEIEVPASLTATFANLVWTAPGDDGFAGSPATEYNLRFSEYPISNGNFGACTRADSIGAPGTVGQPETYQINAGDYIGRLFVALKTADTMGNWSGLSNVATNRIGGYRLRGTFPADGSMLLPATPAVFFFGTGDAVKSAAVAISSSPRFPLKAVARPGGGTDTSVRTTVKAGAGSLKLSSGTWKKVKTLVQTDGIVHWRLEGKTLMVKTPVFVFGPTRSAYFNIGTITGLAVSPSHDVAGSDGVWPELATLPIFSWTSNSPTSAKYFVDISTLPSLPLKDKKSTLVLGAKGIIGSSYQMTVAEWKKIRLLARTNGLLYWRVRGTDAEGLLGCGSGIEPVVIDTGDWTLGGPATVVASPATFTWTNTGNAHGITAYNLQFSADSGFALEAGITVSAPTKPFGALTYTLGDAEKAALQKLGINNGVTTLYWRVRGVDAENAFAGFSPSETIAIH